MLYHRGISQLSEAFSKLKGTLSGKHRAYRLMANVPAYMGVWDIPNNPELGYDVVCVSVNIVQELPQSLSWISFDKGYPCSVSNKANNHVTIYNKYTTHVPQNSTHKILLSTTPLNPRS